MAEDTFREVEKETAPQIDITKKYPLTTLKFVRNLGISKQTVMLDIGGGDIKDKHTIKVPGRISDCKTFVSGTWKDYAFDELYTHTTEQINGKNYYIYTMKDEAYVSGAVGGSRLKFTVNPN